MAKPKALLAWELGGGLGHLRVLSVLGRALEERGFDAVIAAPDMQRAAASGLDPAVLRQGVEWPPVAAHLASAELRPQASRDTGQILARAGFHDPDLVASIIGRWDTVLAAEKPDVVVADYAPGLLLAARGRVPAALVGEGYTVPPQGAASFPRLHDMQCGPLVDEATLLDNANTALRRHGRPPLSRWAESMQGAAHFACTFPLLDPFSSQRREQVMGPMEHVLPEISDEPGNGVFVYLHGEDMRQEKVLRAILQLEAHCIVHAPGMPPAAARLLTERGHRVMERPAPMAEFLPRVRAVLHRGGHGLAALALAAGRPQFMLTTHQGNFLIARALSAAGLGRFHRLGAADYLLAARIAQVLDDDAMAKRTIAKARELRNSFPEPAPARVGAELQRLAGRRLQ